MTGASRQIFCSNASVHRLDHSVCRGSAGVKVTIISRRGLLPEAEPEIGEALTRYFEIEDINLVNGIAYDRIEAKDNSNILTVQDKNGIKEITTEKVLVATCRIPNTDRLNLAAAGIELAPIAA